MDSPTPKSHLITPASKRKDAPPTSSLFPEALLPGTSPEVIGEDQDPKYLVVDDENPQSLPKKDDYAPGVGGAQAEKEVHDKRRGRICGLKRRTFWIVLVVAVVVVAGAVGGGVGGALAGKSKGTSAAASTTPSPSTKTTGTKTSSPTSSSSPTATGFSNGCPNADSTVYTPLNPSNNSQPITIWNTTLSYKVLCNTNYASQSSGVNPQITERQRIENLTSLDECLSRCATYNFQLPDWQNDPNNPDFGVLCSMGVYGISPGTSECYLQTGDWSNASNVGFGTNTEIVTGVLEWPGIG